MIEEVHQYEVFKQWFLALQEINPDDKILILYKSKKFDSLVATGLTGLYLKQRGLASKTAFLPVKNENKKNEHGLSYYSSSDDLTYLDLIQHHRPDFLINLGVRFDYTTMHKLNSIYDGQFVSITTDYCFDINSDYILTSHDRSISLHMYKILGEFIDANSIYDKTILANQKDFCKPVETFGELFEVIDKIYRIDYADINVRICHQAMLSGYHSLSDFPRIHTYAHCLSIKTVLHDLETYMYFDWKTSPFFRYGEVILAMKTELAKTSLEQENQRISIEIEGKRYKGIMLKSSKVYAIELPYQILESDKEIDLTLIALNGHKIDLLDEQAILTVSIRSHYSGLARVLAEKLGGRGHEDAAGIKLTLAEFRQLFEQGLNNCKLHAELSPDVLI